MRAAGDAFELRACAELERAGLKLLDRNYHTRYGELDLVMLDRNAVVFVEVRYRKSASHGDGAASITSSKQAKLILAHSNGWPPIRNTHIAPAVSTWSVSMDQPPLFARIGCGRLLRRADLASPSRRLWWRSVPNRVAQLRPQPVAADLSSLYVSETVHLFGVTLTFK